ncbi:amylo-alpha-1,6-glucosidase [Microbacterium schleiferi]|uniref:Amylo-alpha-1,6-glucosidase n=1 Tax=Microbacterium schleiferi TaxID=69362 RepID=A0A7S8MYQ7_9MICO|nr:glycogen debranching N-terminal domain-containing protein [Microbacterium schleiferi]QPE05645.1 amylo-alpha-1,6-glucosidase [Microbacterium schleiferi]
MTDDPHPPRQPLLSDSVIVLRAPTQVWGSRGGDIGEAAIDGVFHGDVRVIRSLTVHCDESDLETISTVAHGADRAVFGLLARGIDDPMPDPKVRILRDRRVGDGSLTETLIVQSHVTEAIRLTLRAQVRPEFSSLHDVKAGAPAPQQFTIEAVASDRMRVTAGSSTVSVAAPNAAVDTLDGAIDITWSLDLPPAARVEREIRIDITDPTLVVRGASSPAPWDLPLLINRVSDPRLRRWLGAAMGDLDALRMSLPADPTDEFFAAGAPWFFTLFGRDSLWAARFALPVAPEIAASTLRVLARVQGHAHDAPTAQEPGKIPHELRSAGMQLPAEGVALPPLYYGSVDATPLWVCLLVDAWRSGMPEGEVRELAPALRAALRWMLEEGDTDGDGFLDYIDRSGHGLANQGWKDSGDSIQWRDGRLAEGPIALCEVQGYAYEAAVGGAELLENMGLTDVDDPVQPAVLREWARDLRNRFAEAYWVTTPEGRYPAVALDRHKRPVDTLTSNVGHLLGTGILDPRDEAQVATLLRGATLSSGYGIRTMSTEAAGYWPLSYHGGSVWAHDTAIAAWGMARTGLSEDAAAVAQQLIDAAEGFGYRVPELYAGDSQGQSPVPTPYPAACRPQAWSAAAAIVCADILSRPISSRDHNILTGSGLRAVV